MKFSYIVEGKRKLIEKYNLMQYLKNNDLSYDFKAVLNQFLIEMGFTLLHTWLWELKGITIHLTTDVFTLNCKNNREKITFKDTEWRENLYKGFLVDISKESIEHDPKTNKVSNTKVEIEVSLHGFLELVLNSIRKVWC